MFAWQAIKCALDVLYSFRGNLRSIWLSIFMATSKSFKSALTKIRNASL